MWLEDDGLHMAVSAPLLLVEALGRLTDIWQERIRNSPLWDQMVEQFGREKGEERLKNGPRQHLALQPGDPRCSKANWRLPIP